MKRWLGFGAIVAIGAIGWFVVGSVARGNEHGGQEHGGTTLTQEEQQPVAHEHGGKEHGGQERGGQTTQADGPAQAMAPSAAWNRNINSARIASNVAANSSR